MPSSPQNDPQDRAGLLVVGVGIVMIAVGVVAAVLLAGRWLLPAPPNPHIPNEATLQLRILADGAAAFYMSERYSPQGKPLPKRFPVAATSSRLTHCCHEFGADDPDRDRRCVYEAQVWQQPGFREAKFAPNRPLFYVYAIEGNGAHGADARLRISARADIGCDGVTTEHWIEASVDPESGEVVVSPVQERNPRERR